MKPITKKVRCLHCGDEIVGSNFSTESKKCKCAKVGMNGIIIIEGVEGKDYIDTSAVLLNETA